MHSYQGCRDGTSGPSDVAKAQFRHLPAISHRMPGTRNRRPEQRSRPGASRPGSPCGPRVPVRANVSRGSAISRRPRCRARCSDC